MTPSRHAQIAKRLGAKLRRRASLCARASDAPHRPILSPLLPSLACAWGAARASVSAGTAAAFGERWLGVEPCLLLALLCMAILATGLATSCRLAPARPFVILALTGLLGGGVAGGMFIEGTLAAGDRLRAEPVSAYAFIVETDPKVGSRGEISFEAAAIPNSLDNGAVPGTHVRVTLPADAATREPLRMGHRVCLVGSWEKPDTSEWGRTLLARGCAAGIKAKRCSIEGSQRGVVGAIRRMRAYLLDAIESRDDPGRALVAGVVLGEQASLSTYPVSKDFANLGLTHLVAVSGSHLAVIAGIMSIGLGGLRLRPEVRLTTQIIVLGAYVILSGLQPSALRSFAMVLTAQVATVSGRRAHVPSALGAAALLMLLFDPSNATSMGFTLSVLSVLGISTLSGLVAHWITSLTHPICMPGGLRDSLALTLVSQVLTMPVTLPAFGVLPMLSPLANVLLAPIMTALLPVGLACVPLASIAPSVAPIALAPCDALANIACGLAGLLARVPYAALPCDISPVPCALVTIFFVLAVYAAWPLPSPRTARLVLDVPLVAVFLTFMSWRLLAPARIVVLDVGQGDAILVQQGAAAMLVDTGPDDAVLSALARKHVLHLDAVLLTHTDTDHTGGLASLRGLVGVGRVIVAQGVGDHIRASDPTLQHAIDDASGGRVQEVRAGDTLRFGDFALDIASPQGSVSGDENPDSIVAVARYSPAGPLSEGRSLNVLLTGDAEQDLTGPLARKGLFGDVDVLKVGHHGSAVSTSPELLAGCLPELAVVSAGEHNRYGHPTQTCKDVLSDADIPLLCTIETGDIELRPGTGGVAVRCQHRDALQAVLLRASSARTATGTRRTLCWSPTRARRKTRRAATGWRVTWRQRRSKRKVRPCCTPTSWWGRTSSSSARLSSVLRSALLRAARRSSTKTCSTAHRSATPPCCAPRSTRCRSQATSVSSSSRVSTKRPRQRVTC